VHIAIGSDHAGFELKTEIESFLCMEGHDIHDVGAFSSDAADYPDYAHLVVHKIRSGTASLGVLICGTGIGMGMTANRYPGIRAAVCTDTFMARVSREHNDANVLCLGSRVIGVGLALDIVNAWLNASFAGGRHQRRIEKIELTAEWQPEQA
jgi:ribose 5-phosphate isomerase B